jgi:hypothetical protein
MKITQYANSYPFILILLMLVGPKLSYPTAKREGEGGREGGSIHFENTCGIFYLQCSAVFVCKHFGET